MRRRYGSAGTTASRRACCSWQSNKELRRKLKEERQQAEGRAQQLEAAAARIASDEAVQAKLQAELVNLRAYLAAHPGATPTRVTKAALKEISLAAAPAPARTAWPDEPDNITPR